MIDGLQYIHPVGVEVEDNAVNVDTVSLRRVSAWDGNQRFRWNLTLETVRDDDPRIGALTHRFARARRVRTMQYALPQTHPAAFGRESLTVFRTGSMYDASAFADGDLIVAADAMAGAETITIRLSAQGLARNRAMRAGTDAHVPAGCYMRFGAAGSPSRVHMMGRATALPSDRYSVIFSGDSETDTAAVPISPALSEDVPTGRAIVVESFHGKLDGDLLLRTRHDGGVTPQLTLIEV